MINDHDMEFSSGPHKNNTCSYTLWQRPTEHPFTKCCGRPQAYKAEGIVVDRHLVSREEVKKREVVGN